MLWPFSCTRNHKAEKERQQRADREPIANEQQARAQAEKAQQQRDRVIKEFGGMAAKRSINASGYRDTSEE